jgi:hypothetical protein
MEWFIEHRQDLTHNVAWMQSQGEGRRRLLSIIDPEQLRRILRVMLDEREFLSPYGIRAVSQAHRERPFVFEVDGADYRVDYEPGESSTALFGSNSIGRGRSGSGELPVVESLQKVHHYLGEDFKVECPTGSGNLMTLWEVSAEISRRMTRILLKDADGRRPVHGANDSYKDDPNWRDLVLFYEYFHGDTGAGDSCSRAAIASRRTAKRSPL